MSTNQKLIKKRKWQSPLSSSSSMRTRIPLLNQRLEAARKGQRNLWDDDSDLESSMRSKRKIINNKTYIVLSDSDDEKSPNQQQSKRKRFKREKISQNSDENLPIDNEIKTESACVTCLICSILTTLTKYNCCSKHLSLLVHNQTFQENQPQANHHMNSWPTKQVMIVPITDDLIQRYMNPHEFNHIRTSTIQDPSVNSGRSIRKGSKRPFKTSESSDTDHSNRTKLKSSTRSSRIELEKSNSSSSIIIDSSQPNSGKISQDTTYTVITSTSTSTSTTINSFESPNLLDTCQLHHSSDQPIIIGDSQNSTQPDNLPTNNTQKNQSNDPWTPISDDTYAAIETVLHRTDQPLQDQSQFTPATVRRTPTDLMASRLPRIQLKTGRFRQGKPVVDKNTTDGNLDECQSSTICQSSTSTSTSIIITNNRPPPSSLETIIEDESLVIQATHPTSDKPSQRHESVIEGLSDTVMSCLFAQDELTEHDNIHIITKPISNEDDRSRRNDINKSTSFSQLSQLTNDRSDIQLLIPSTNNESLAKRSYRMNPDGSRVNISRSSHHQSSFTSLRGMSSDATPMTLHTKK